MKDIPCFATENGVAGLSIQQIPYNGSAYITIHSTLALDAFLEECIGFCRAVGAEQIFACGHKELEKYPVHTRILRMHMQMPEDRESGCLLPVTENTLNTWLEIYNAAMKNVPNAEILSQSRGKELIDKGGAYFVHLDGTLMGIGAISDSKVDAIVSCQKGAGEMVLKTLCGALFGDMVEVEVAENNMPAVRLYNRLGFITTGVVNTWYEILKKV